VLVVIVVLIIHLIRVVCLLGIVFWLLLFFFCEKNVRVLLHLVGQESEKES
jgi:hypothetical protein